MSEEDPWSECENININMDAEDLSKHDECITPSPRGPNYPFLLTAAREQFVLKLARVSAGSRESCGHTSINIELVCTIPFLHPQREHQGHPGLCVHED